ncbi:MAG: hypothetical protein WD232_10180 [Acidimicrobiales bacterium]
MGAQQRVLEAALLGAGWRKRTVPLPTAESLNAIGLGTEVATIYRRLGGVGAAARVAPGGWDIATDPFVVELDEQRHFNRFRRATLDSAIYDSNPIFDTDAYRRFCDDHEADCLRSAKHGGYWATPVSDREFGVSGPLGVIDGLGPSRWRQRAFYDFVKDTWALATRLPMLRLAVWDVVDDETQLTLGTLLTRLVKKPDAQLTRAVHDYLERRVAKVGP